MDLNLLHQHIEKYKKFITENADIYAEDVRERQERMRVDGKPNSWDEREGICRIFVETLGDVDLKVCG